MKKCFEYRHILCIIITLGFIACGLLFPNAVGRIIESGRDFGLSIAFYFCELFGIEYGFTPTVNDYPKIPFFPSFSGGVTPAPSLPDTWTGFQSNWVIYWQLWASKENFFGYLDFIAECIYNFCFVLIIILPFILLFYILFRRYMKKQNNDYDKDSKPLKAFKWLTAHTYRPVKTWIIGFITFIRERKGYWVTWLCLWLFYFNVFTIIIEFLAYYFYFVMSFDVINIYRQLYKLFLDLSVPIKAIPLWAWAIIGFILFDMFRKKIGYARLNHNERKNCGFINERALVSLVCGTMGKGKTTMLTSMCLSTEVLFRDKAFELLLESDMKFPNFPWINLENFLRKEISNHSLYNLATCRYHIRNLRNNWLSVQSRENIFNYDYERYGLTYNDNLNVVDVWSVIEDYAQLYFIYVMESSLLISNYSIRSDMLISDLGNFPLWNGDFFKRDSRLIDSYSRHAHILDFDMLRLGKQIVKDNKLRNAFEFGVVAVSEIGKERLNSKVSQSRGLKAKDDVTNQENDGFNDGLKMARHRATVCNYPFLKIISDEQRAMSVGADARELFDVINIYDKTDTALMMPFFSLEELIYSAIFGKFCNLYTEYRYNRGDNTLLMYLMKAVIAKFNHYYNRTYNVFGCHLLRIQVGSGSMEDTFKEKNYYISRKKDYSKRFATDCFADFFREKALTSEYGLNDIDEYETERATWEEMTKQGSYFIRDLTGLKEKPTDGATDNEKEM